MARGPHCPATREAVVEREQEHGDIGCPICGRAAEEHVPQLLLDIKRAAYDAKVREMRDA